MKFGGKTIKSKWLLYCGGIAGRDSVFSHVFQKFRPPPGWGREFFLSITYLSPKFLHFGIKIDILSPNIEILIPFFQIKIGFFKAITAYKPGWFKSFGIAPYKIEKIDD